MFNPAQYSFPEFAHTPQPLKEPAMNQPNPFRATLTPGEIWTQRDRLKDHLPVGGFPHIAAIDGTVFDPPMSIEHIHPENEVCQPMTPGLAEAAPDLVFGIGLTVWPKGGWMIAISLNFRGQHNVANQVEVVWL